MKTLKKWYLVLMEQPESIRRTFLIVFVLMAIPPVIGVWFLSFTLSSARNHAPSDGNKATLPPQVVQEFQNGTANLGGALRDLNLNIASPFKSEKFIPRERASIFKMHLPIVK